MPGSNQTSQKVNTSIRGIVVDESKTPLSGVNVSFAGMNTATDENGWFRFNDVEVDKNRAFVKAETSGYFQGSRTFIPSENGTSLVRIMMLQKNVIGTVSASSGGELSTSSGAKVNLPANGFIDESGNAYNGIVAVSAKWLDPTHEDIAVFMPGDLLGEDAAGQEQGLESFGMMAVELTGTSGQELNLSKNATLTFPVPASLLGAAPSTIPLWSFDEEEGIWKEEGSADLVGNEYIGQVSHFSFWNCDAPFPLVELEGLLEYEDGSPVQSSLVSRILLFVGSDLLIPKEYFQGRCLLMRI